MKGSRIIHDIGHLIDFLPTFAELAGIEVPSRYEGRNVLPPEGRSLVPLLKDENTAAEDRELYWIIGGARAMRQGR